MLPSHNHWCSAWMQVPGYCIYLPGYLLHVGHLNIQFNHKLIKSLLLMTSTSKNFVHLTLSKACSKCSKQTNSSSSKSSLRSHSNRIPAIASLVLLPVLNQNCVLPLNDLLRQDIPSRRKSVEEAIMSEKYLFRKIISDLWFESIPLYLDSIIIQLDLN